MVSLAIIFAILISLTQMSVNFGYRMGMMDTVKQQSQTNF
jgi:hypothetical protein